MDNRTRAALEGSVEKWEKIVDGKGKDEGMANCALCETFRLSGVDCTGCPVALRTGKSNCVSSPYEEWYFHGYRHSASHPGRRVIPGCPDCERLARTELDFLRSLREPPEVETP